MDLICPILIRLTSQVPTEAWHFLNLFVFCFKLFRVMFKALDFKYY